MPEVEIWKDIEGYEGYYQCSNLGRIKSLKRNYIAGNGGVRKKPELILKGTPNNYGYHTLDLSREGNRNSTTIHRLIAMTFIANPSNLTEVNHKNCNKLDNRSENLEWTTKLDNNRHAQDNGLIPYKIKNEDVLKIKELYTSGFYKQKQLAELFNIHPCFVSRIVNNKRRKRAIFSNIKN